MEDYVLVTGASSGIGRAIAVRLSKSYQVILCGRDEARLEETRMMCRYEEKTLTWQHDFSDLDGIGENLRDFLKERSIHVSGFVHSAGISPLMPLRMTSVAFMHEIMNVNFFSSVEILKLLTSRKVNGKSLSRVVFISSIQSSLGAKGQGIYCASKAAIEGFMRAMAVELATSVRLNVICPGGIKTSMGGFLEENEELLSKHTDDGYLLGLGEVNDIANMAEFLLSDKAKWITGQIFTVDGGRCAH